MTLSAVSVPLAALAAAAMIDAGVAGSVLQASFWAGVAGLSFWASLTMEHLAHIFFFELADLQAISAELRLIEAHQGPTSIENHLDPEHADRVALLRRDAELFGEGVPAVLGTATVLAQLLLTVALLGWQDPLLVALPLFAVPAVAAGAIAERRRHVAELRTAERQRSADRLLGLSVDPQAAEEIRVLGIKQLLRHRQSATRATIRETMLRTELSATVLRIGGQLVFVAGYFGAVLLVVRQVVAGGASLGAVVLVVTLAVQMNGQVAGALAVTKELQRSLRAFRILDEVELMARADAEAFKAPQVPAPRRLTAGIRMDGLTFRYPGASQNSLDGLSLELPAGQMVALVGENGAGKSTLVALLSRLFEPSAGSITVDGVDLASIPADEWRQVCAVSLQEVVQYELLAREAIGIGDVEKIDDEGAILAAVGRASADEVIDQLPQGLNTPLGSTHRAGSDLSGGQWQRVALSRVAMRTSRILTILDEPHAALDPRTEHAVMLHHRETAQELARRSGAVTLVISHRMSTAAMADVVVVIDGGRVVETGPPADLLVRGGVFARLLEQQAAAYR